MFTNTARSLRSTLESMATPSCVKAYGSEPPRLRFEGITFCDTNASASSWLSRNMKSGGKRASLRPTCWRSAIALTPYRSARSRSSMTFCPRMSKMARSIRSAGIKDRGCFVPMFFSDDAHLHQTTTSPFQCCNFTPHARWARSNTSAAFFRAFAAPSPRISRTRSPWASSSPRRSRASAK